MALIWHDWFATSATSSARSGSCIAPEPALPHARARHRSTTCSQAITIDPAMLLWLNGDRQHEVTPERELRPRDDGALLARAPTAAPTPRTTSASRHARSPAGRTTGTTTSGRQLPLRPGLHDNGAQDDLRPDRATSTGGLRAASCSTTRCTRRTSSTSSGRTSFRPRRRGRRWRRCERSTSRRPPDPPGRRGDPHAPRTSTTAPRIVKPPVVFIAGMLRARRRSIDTDSWAWLADIAGQQPLRPAERRRLGRDRWLDTSTLRGAGPPSPSWSSRMRSTPTTATTRTRRRGGGRPRARATGQPAVSLAHPQRAARLRAAASTPRDRRDWERERVPRASPERAAHADRHLPGSADLLTAELLRLQRVHPRRSCCARAAAQAGPGLPAIEPGMPMPGGHRPRPPLLPVARRAALLSVYGASRLGIGAAPGGHREAAGGRPQPVLVTIFLEGGIDGLSVLAPVNDPRYQQLRPTLKLSPGAGAAFAEDTSLHWHPRPRGLHDLHEAGKVSVMPAVSYDRPRTSRTSPRRHYWEVGALDPYGRTRLARAPARRDRHPRQPASGALAGRQPLAGAAPRKVPVAAVDGPADFDFWAPGVWGDVETLMFDAYRPRGRRTGHHGPQLAQAPAPRRQAMRAPLLRRSSTRQPASRSRYLSRRRRRSFPATWRRSPRSSPPACRSAASRSNAPGSYDTHEEQTGDLTSGLKLTADTLAAFQARPRGARPRRPGDDPLWSEFGRAPEENDSAAPTTAPPASASSSARPSRAR